MSKFKVLWIDDQPAKIDLEKEKAEELIRAKGFEPIIEVYSDIDQKIFDSKSELINRLRSRGYDLLFIDYNLCNHILGSHIISEVRKHNDIYVDIVFYSSDRDKLIKEIKSSYDKPSLGFIDDVHVAILDELDFYDKIEYIIDKIIGAWFNAHSIRGIILAKASKFERLVSDIVQKNYFSIKDTLVEVLKTKRERIDEQDDNKWKKLFSEKDPTLYVIQHPTIFNWGIISTLFRTLLDKKIITANETLMGTLKEIFIMRNDFAHYKATIKDGKLILHKCDKNKEFDEDKIKQIRDKINFVETELNLLLNE